MALARKRKPNRIAAFLALAAIAAALSSCSGGAGSLPLHGTITYQQTLSCGGSLAEALITISGNSGQVGSGKPISVTGPVCDQRAQYSIPVQRSSSYALALRVSGAVSYEFGPYSMATLQGSGFRLDITISGDTHTTTPAPG